MTLQIFLIIIGLNTSPNKQFNQRDTLSTNTVRNSITLKNSFYIVRANRLYFKTTSAKLFKDTIKVNLPKLKKYTLYIFLNHFYDDNLYKLNKILTEYRINKKLFVITDDFYKLPYQ